jgi:hypothetical protein
MFQAYRDENTVSWAFQNKNGEFARARDLIQARIAAATAGGAKVCPDCAEEVKAAANICRFCGHRFDAVPEGNAV